MGGSSTLPSTPARAWPFLVARGRYRGYRTLLAPDFLVTERDYGVLDDSVVPNTREDHPKVIELVTRAGRRMTVVHATRQVTSADIAEPGTEPASHAPRDQHSRPLQLIYGFVCVDGWIPEPHHDDLLTSRETALKVYRRFLGDEDGFTVESGREFPLRSRLTPTERSSPLPRPSPDPWEGPGEPVPVGAAWSAGSTASKSSTVNLGNLVLLAAILLVAAAAMFYLLRPGADDPDDRPPATPTPSPSSPATPPRPAR